MNWHYLENGQQRGPVTDHDLAALAAQGTITGETLIWREGLQDWRPYQEVLGQTAPAATPAPPSGQVVCCECQRVYPLDEVIRHGNVYVCGACKPVFLQRLREGVAPVGAMTYAGFWIRAGAKILDIIILMIPMQLVNLALTPMMPRAIPPQIFSAGLVLGSLVNIVIGAAYYTLMVGKYGATVGKMAAKLRIVNADGSAVSYGKACGRYFAEFLSALICDIGYIMVAFDDEKRGLHDRICNTRVIRK